MQERQGHNRIQILPVLLLLFCISVMAGLMAGSGSKNLRDFYNNGKVFQMEVKDTEQLKFQGIQVEDGKYYVVTEDAKISLKRATKAAQYYYIYVNVSELNQDFMFVKFCYYNEKKQRIAQQLDAVMNGDNTLTIPVAGDISQVKMMIPSQKGTEFVLNKVEMRTQIVSFSKKRAAVGVAAAWITFFALYILSRRIGKIPGIQNYLERVKAFLAKVLVVLQSFYMLQEKPAKWIRNRYSAAMRSRMRILIIAIASAYGMYMQHWGLFAKASDYKYHMLLLGMMILWIGWSLYEGKLEYKKWNSPLTRAWFLYWISVCIADAAMGSEYHFLGYWMILVVGSLFFFWSNQEQNREQLLYEMIYGVIIGVFIYLLANGVHVLIKQNGVLVSELPTLEQMKIAWKTYAFDINLIGHARQANTAGLEVLAYNGLIEVSYRYGIFILLPYVMLLWNNGKEMLGALKKGAIPNKQTERLLLAIEGVFFLALIVSNVEIPFTSPIWLLYYLHLGYFFQKS